MKRASSALPATSASSLHPCCYHMPAATPPFPKPFTVMPSLRSKQNHQLVHRVQKLHRLYNHEFPPRQNKLQTSRINSGTLFSPANAQVEAVLYLPNSGTHTPQLLPLPGTTMLFTVKCAVTLDHSDRQKMSLSTPDNLLFSQRTTNSRLT